MTMEAVRRTGTVLAATGLCVALVAVGGCGAPAYTYVKNSGEHTYFKLPREWHRVDQNELDNALSQDDPNSAAAIARKQVVWNIAYDADAPPSALHMFVASGDEPFVFATVRALSTGQRDAMSYDAMRDFVLPVTVNAREAAATNGLQLDDFELLRDDVLSPHTGIRGVRVVYNYRLVLGPLQTFDQTTYVNADTSRVYIILIRCSAACYRQQLAELDGVATSFTVRSP
jgi:hypothetical protein